MAKITDLPAFAARGAAAQAAVDKLTERRFRAILVCETCGKVVLTGPWSAGDRAWAAYLLGRAPAGMSKAVFDHMRAGNHSLTVSYEDEPA